MSLRPAATAGVSRAAAISPSQPDGDGRAEGVATVALVSLTSLVQQFERRAAEAEAVGATAPVANVYRLVLEELKGVDAAPNRNTATEDRLLDVRQAAARLGTTPRWLYRHAKKLPFTRKLSPKVLRFSSVGMERWLQRRGVA